MAMPQRLLIGVVLVVCAVCVNRVYWAWDSPAGLSQYSVYRIPGQTTAVLVGMALPAILVSVAIGLAFWRSPPKSP